MEKDSSNESRKEEGAEPPCFFLTIKANTRMSKIRGTRKQLCTSAADAPYLQHFCPVGQRGEPQMQTSAVRTPAHLSVHTYNDDEVSSSSKGNNRTF